MSKVYHRMQMVGIGFLKLCMNIFLWFLEEKVLDLNGPYISEISRNLCNLSAGYFSILSVVVLCCALSTYYSLYRGLDVNSQPTVTEFNSLWLGTLSYLSVKNITDMVFVFKIKLICSMYDIEAYIDLQNNLWDFWQSLGFFITLETVNGKNN